MSNLDLNRRPALATHVRLKIDPVSGEPILLFPEGLLILNNTAHEIVQRCDGQTCISKLASDLAEEFEADEDVLQQDVLENLENLERRNLIYFQ